MEKEFVFGERVFCVNYKDKDSARVFEEFVKAMKEVEKEINGLMDVCVVPKEVVLNFKRGNGSLDGNYHVQGEKTSENVVAIDIFTKQWAKSLKKKERFVRQELMHTFAHEIYHNIYASEKKTEEKAQKFLRKILKKIK